MMGDVMLSMEDLSSYELISQPHHQKIFDVTLCKKASNHHANLPLEMYSFTL